MATVDRDQVKAALAGVVALLQDARLLPDQARVSATKETLKSVMETLPDDAGGSVTAKHWADLSADDQQSILNKLNAVRNDLTIQVSSPGLFGSRMLMSSDPAPTWVVLLLLLIALAGTGVVLRLVINRWDAAFPVTETAVQRQPAPAAPPATKSGSEESSKDTQPKQGETTGADQKQKDTSEKKDAGEKKDTTKTTSEPPIRTEATQSVPTQRAVIVMVILLGTLGGLIHLASSLTMYVGNRDLKRSWIIYYVLAPVQGGSLAPLVYLLLKAAVLSPQSAGGGTQNLNLTAIYAFAGLTGLFAKQAIEKLADVFATVFAPVKAQDKTKDGAKPAGSK